MQAHRSDPATLAAAMASAFFLGIFGYFVCLAAVLHFINVKCVRMFVLFEIVKVVYFAGLFAFNLVAMKYSREVIGLHSGQVRNPLAIIPQENE